MSREEAGKLSFLDSLAKFVQRAGGEKPERGPAEAGQADQADRLQVDFDSALRRLEERIAERAAAADERGAATRAPGTVPEDSAVRRARRMEEAHRAIREDIAAMHARLGTGIAARDLEVISSFLHELDGVAAEGRDSRRFAARSRYAIGQKLQAESGKLALARLVELMQRAGMDWPDPTERAPGATAADIERSRRRRLAEARESFEAAGFKRTAERMLGIISAWGAEYPDRGSTLWEESVIEGVAAGIRGQIVKQSIDVLRQDEGAIRAQAESSVGAEVNALHGVLEGGITSLEKANQAVSSALRVLDEVVPQIAWDHVRAKLPVARGEWPS